jgi:hypothetical protein
VEERDTCPYPSRFDHTRVGWERAAFDHPDDPAAEGAAKSGLLAARAWSLLASLTGELDAYRAAARAAPAVAAARAAFGCALARSGAFPAAAAEVGLRFHPTRGAMSFDRAAARALVQALADIGDTAGRGRAVAALRRLSATAPALFPAEPWFAAPDPPPLASLVVLCCNEADVTRLCLESVLAHTRAPYELVVVDNGSDDDTPAVLAAAARRAGPDRVTVVRNARNLGYPAGVNQGLALARGESVVLLNNDVVVTPGWLDRLERCAANGVGLAGPVTNYAPRRSWPSRGTPTSRVWTRSPPAARRRSRSGHSTSPD